MYFCVSVRTEHTIAPPCEAQGHQDTAVCLCRRHHVGHRGVPLWLRLRRRVRCHDCAARWTQWHRWHVAGEGLVYFFGRRCVCWSPTTLHHCKLLFLVQKSICDFLRIFEVIPFHLPYRADVEHTSDQLTVQVVWKVYCCLRKIISDIVTQWFYWVFDSGSLTLYVLRLSIASVAACVNNGCGSSCVLASWGCMQRLPWSQAHDAHCQSALPHRVYRASG